MPKQIVKLELFYSGVWNDMVALGLVVEDSIRIQHGYGNETGGLRPCQLTARLNNADDRFRTSNPLSPLYGLAGRNTLVRVSVAGGTLRGVMEVQSWICDQTLDFRTSPARGRAWTDIVAAGFLARVLGWTQLLRSAYFRAVELSGVTPGEWWPMEDVAGSSSAVSACGGAPMLPDNTVSSTWTLPGGSPIPPGGLPDFARGAGIPGTAALPNFQRGGTLRGGVRPDAYNGYAWDWVMQFQADTDAGGTTSADVLKWRETGTYVSFTVNVTKNNITVFYSNAADDATLTFTGSASAAFDMYGDGSPHHFRFQVRQSGGSYLAQLLIDSAVYATAVNFAGGMAGTVGQPTGVNWNPGRASGDYMPIAAGGLVLWKSGQIGGQPPTFFALNGYSGERAGNRFARLMGEEGIPYAVSAGIGSSMPMGPQRPDTLPNLINEIVATEDALLFDELTNTRLIFLCRGDRVNQTPALTVGPSDFPANEVGALPKEVTDRSGIANVITVSQRDGGDVSVQDDTSPLSTQPPPAGINEVKRTYNVNLANPSADLVQLGNWYLRRNTVNLPRFPSMTFDLNGNTSVIAEVEAVTVGAVVEVTGLREYVIRQTILGWTPEAIDAYGRWITFMCAPDQQFVLPVLNTGKLQARSTTLNAGVTSGATTIVLSSTEDAEQWRPGVSTAHVMIAGEEIALGTIGARTGTGPWTWTVTGCTRAVNGIPKAQVSGAPLSVKGAIRLGLRETS